MKICQVLLFILGLTFYANAQNGILKGTIYDQFGNVIVKAKVTAINKKGEKFEAVTNDEGNYVLNIPIDEYKPVLDQKITKYDIAVEAAGFEKILQKDFKFVASTKGQMYLDFALDIGAIIDKIPVPTKKTKRKT